jgi:diphosphomevalonate decarboxylase
MTHSSKQATARAHPNIAFIKYWGNRDDHLRLPANSSVSMNLDGLYTETTVTWNDDLTHDELVLNGEVAAPRAIERVEAHLDALRERTGITGFAHIISSNNFPMGAGIASSASAFAALTAAAITAAGMRLSERELTTLSRLGSGSAARSIPGGFVEWHTAQTHSESFAESIAGPEYWDIVDIIAIVSGTHKTVVSQQGHRSAHTSDLQTARLAGAAKRVEICKAAILERNFSTFVDVLEQDSNLMHAVMMTSKPPLFYWLPETLTVMDAVRRWRANGLQVGYTLDAGPNVHCICIRHDADQVISGLKMLSDNIEIRIAQPGGPTVITTSEK